MPTIGADETVERSNRPMAAAGRGFADGTDRFDMRQFVGLAVE